MSLEKWFQGKLDRYVGDPEFLAEEKILDFTEKLVVKMKEQNLTRVDLAKRLGVSKAFVSKLLNGSPNMTVKTMVTVALALGCELNLDIFPRGFKIKTLYLGCGAERYSRNFNLIIDETFHASAA